MKTIASIFLLIVVIVACQPDEFPGLGERKQIVPQLNGTWTITSVTQIDNDAQRKGFPLFAQIQDVTADFPFSDFKITLNTNDAGIPTTFAINLGDSPNIVGIITSGNWVVDDIDYPSIITFSGSEESTIQLGSLAELGSKKLTLKVVRNQLKAGNPEPVITYEYVLTKNN